MAKGFLSIVLHAHLPYVRHPEHESFFEENWLFEAITECYVPLISMFDRLLRENVQYRLTLSLSPTLMTMLKDDLLQKRYIKHLHKLIHLAEKEIKRTRHESEVQRLARLYRRMYLHTLKVYQQDYHGDLLAAFKKHYHAGRLELITSAATHGFLPALNVSHSAVYNQIHQGVDNFVTHFGFTPKGFWLPECGYYPGLEHILKDNGVEYFYLDTHGIMHADPRPQNGVYAPLDCGNSVLAYARDPESSRQVWSTDEGYPGDFDYREYHRDIGFDLPAEDLGGFIFGDGSRIHTGIKYHRVTGVGQSKGLYRPREARNKTRQHAEDFLGKRQQQVEALNQELDRPPMIVAPYDAELFGHWWFEGPLWLEYVLRMSAADNECLTTLSTSDYLQLGFQPQQSQPSASTWGDKGYSGYWINDTTDWVFPLLHKAEKQMQKLAFDFRRITVNSLQERALNQAARTLLLAQASDWPFIIQSGTTVEYAKKRINDHLARFNYLHDNIRSNSIDERYLSALEYMDLIFPDIDFRDYYRPPEEASI